MAGKRIEIHPAALAELKSAVTWYLERSEPAAREFVADVDRAIALGSALRDVGRSAITTRANLFCGGFLSRSLTAKGSRACKSWRSLMDTDDLDTGRNGCSGKAVWWHEASRGSVRRFFRLEPLASPRTPPSQDARAISTALSTAWALFMAS